MKGLQSQKRRLSIIVLGSILFFVVTFMFGERGVRPSFLNPPPPPPPPTPPPPPHHNGKGRWGGRRGNQWGGGTLKKKKKKKTKNNSKQVIDNIDGYCR